MNERADLSRLIGELEPKVRAEFEASIRRHGARINVLALTEALAQGNMAEAERIANIEPRDVFPLGEILRSVFFGGAMLVGRNRRGVVGEFRFDGRSQEAEAWASQNSARLVTRITEESRDAVREAIRSGLDESRSPRSMALDIAGRRVGNGRTGGVVGLTGPQAASIAKARAALASGDPARMREYLKLALRDRRFDSMIRKAIKLGRPIKGADLDRLLDAHKAKALGYRAKVIAQAETFKAAAAGRDQAYRQMLAMPGVTGITLRWQHNLSAEPRVEHVAMNGTVVQLGQPFVFPDGTAMRYPHDDTAPARHVIGCRCTAIYRVQVEKG
jgi:hypothetical protein